jgi:hypothetical protein
MPLPGGPSDKAGNSYERRWTVFAIIDLLEGRASALRIEVPGDDGIGSEFRLTVDGVAQWHQAKRQLAGGQWTISALCNHGVIAPWQAILARGDRCMFVSGTGADELRELADRAENAADWTEFNAAFLEAADQQTRFERLKREWPAFTGEEVYEALRRVTVRTIGEPDLADWVHDRLRAVAVGAKPETIAAVLGQFVDEAVHKEISATEVWAELSKHGVTTTNLLGDPGILGRIDDTARAFLDRLRPLYIGSAELKRPEAAAAIAQLGERPRVVLAGTAGAGKSVVAGQVAAIAMGRGWRVLVVSADRMSDARTTAQLGADLGFPESPSVVLAAAAEGGDALLVIDQVDAVSAASGRHPDRLDLVAGLLRELRNHSNVRVLAACRRFDLDYDRALRSVLDHDSTSTIVVGTLTEQQVRDALASAGLSSAVPDPLMRLLVVPLHLALYVELALAGVSDLTPARTLTELYEWYWKEKRAACRKARGGSDDWSCVVTRLVAHMDERHELTAPVALVDEIDEQVNVMASAGVLTIDRGRVSFFHESFFDYCFARGYLASGSTLRDLLLGSEQDLFRRAQVRQILAYKRGSDVDSYLTDLEWLLTSPEVRLHVKALAASLLETVQDPTVGEWRLIRPMAMDAGDVFFAKTWQVLRSSPGWFPLLAADGTWERLLAAGGDLTDSSMWALSRWAGDYPDRVIELVTGLSGDTWTSRRIWFLRTADIQRARELVDLLLQAIDEGAFDDTGRELAFSIRSLVESHPEWAAEVVAKTLDRSAATGGGPVPIDRARSAAAWARDEIAAIAAGAPAEYVDLILPRLLGLMKENADPDPAERELVRDSMWGHHIYGSRLSTADTLYSTVGDALIRLAGSDPQRAAVWFAALRSEPYESAAFLLARAYTGNPATFADEAAHWLATMPGALALGYSDAPAWVSRELITALSPHCSEAALAELVGAAMYYTTPWQRTYEGIRRRGYTELCLLNGFDAARRPPALNRRLAELRRKFLTEDVHPTEGITGGGVPAPIRENRARHMSDSAWLTAIDHYGATGSTRWRNGQLVGDAWSQAQVLETLTKKDPERFARLLERIPTGAPEPYAAAVFRGLADTQIDTGLLVAVWREGERLGGSDAQRWLVRLVEANRAKDIPDELVKWVAAVAAAKPDRAEAGNRDTEPIDTEALPSTRSAAAIALGNLLAEDHRRASIIVPALEGLASDPNPEVRAAAAAALAPVLDLDSDRALSAFDDLMEGAGPALLANSFVGHFLKIAVHRRQYAAIAPIVTRMLGEQDELVSSSGARWLTLASFYDPALDADVDSLLASPDAAIRAASVEVFADNIYHAPTLPRIVDVLGRALHDPYGGVRAAAERCFHSIGDEPLSDFAPLIKPGSTVLVGVGRVAYTQKVPSCMGE